VRGPVGDYVKLSAGQAGDIDQLALGEYQPVTVVVDVRDMPAEDELLGDADELRVDVDDLDLIEEDDAVRDTATV
jgi:hypothetical protein